MMCPELDSPTWQPVRDYRRWLENQSPYWKKQLRKGDESPRRTAGLNQLELPASSVEFFRVFDGQKSDKQFALPGDGAAGLVLLGVEECASSRSNNLGLSHLIRNLPHEVSYECDEGIRAGTWRKGWFPIARRNNGWGWTLLFVDQEPQDAAAAGRLVLQTMWLGSKQSKCLRTVVAASIPEYFARLLELARTQRLCYQDGKGIAIDPADVEAATVLGLSRPHHLVGEMQE